MFDREIIVKIDNKNISTIHNNPSIEFVGGKYCYRILLILIHEEGGK